MAYTFTRAELYDLVWSRPRTALAKQLGISDVAIGKHCVKARIPTPGMGYWARLSAGTNTVRTPLPLRLPGQSNDVVIGKEIYRHWPRTEELVDLPVPPVFAEDFGDQVALAVNRIGRFVATRDLASPDRSLSKVLEAEAKRRDKFKVDSWRWNKPRFDEPIFQRHLQIFNSLARGFSAVYGLQAVREQDEWLQGHGHLHHLLLHLDFGGVGISLRMHEPGEFRRHGAPKPVTASTLRVETWRKDDPSLEWSDEPGRKIENRLTEIAAGLVRRAEESLRRRQTEIYEENCRRHEEQFAEIAARRLEAERKRLAAIEARRVKIRDEMIELARRRQTAEDIRASVASLRHHPDVLLPEARMRFDAWAANALAVADEMDPLNSPLAAILDTFELTDVASLQTASAIFLTPSSEA